MSQELEHKVRELEEITDIPEPVIDLTEEDVVIDMPVEEKVLGELEEITGLQDITTSTLIIEDENPPLQIQKSDEIIRITANVDAINTIKVVKHTAAHGRLQKEDRLFEDIPEPLHSSTSQKEESHVKDSYIDTTIDDGNKEIKGRIYYDKNIDALVIEDFSEDEKLALKEQEESKEAESGYEFEAQKAMGNPLRADEDNLISDESKIDRPEADTITIEIPPEVRNKIEDKDIEDFKFINLDEAEQIANEDILILSEEDLIEELDEYDLIPVETTIEEKKLKEKKKEKVISDVSVSPTKHEPEKKEEVTDVEPQVIELSEDAITKAEKEKKKVDPVKPIKDEIIQKEENIDLKQEEIPVTKEIITELPEIDKEIKEKLQDKPQPPSHEKNIDIIPLEEEQELMPAPVTMQGTGDSFDTKNLIRDYAQLAIETIPDNLAKAANQKIMIIDDAGVEVKEHLSMEENPIDDIDKLVSGMIEITEGEATILKEASSKEEDEYIAPILTGTLPTFQDRMIEFEEEYKFKDDDIVFIDNAILVNEYDKYLKVIDDYYATKTVKKSSSTIELFGLTKDEFEFFYDILFEKEYETIKASKAFKDITVGRDHPEKDAALVKQFKYIQAKPQSLSDKEKKSIEENIESPVAVVIEENIDDIVERLKKLKPQVDIKKILDQMPHEPSKIYDVNDSKPDTIIEEKPAQQEEITNITDQVIILDSKEDVNRFVDTLPVEKQESIRMLLKYLDSLFDKLPEDVIKNFANSEYFDLYVKVLHELGV